MDQIMAGWFLSVPPILRYLLPCVFTLTIVTPWELRAQVRRETIYGRVETADKAPVIGAQVIATRSPDRAVFVTATQNDGRYMIVVDSGTGDYLLYVAGASGKLQTFRKRLIRQMATDSLFEVNVTLQSQREVQTLARVVVEERKAAPTRMDDLLVGPGGSEAAAAGVPAALAPDLAGDLATLAATVPGVTGTASGASVFGLPESQNSVTLNGMGFSGVRLPRDAATRVRYVTSVFDPSRGWFSGMETNVELSQDFLFSSLNNSASFDSPSLSSATRMVNGGRLGGAWTTLAEGMGGTGFAASERLSYNVSIQGTQRTARRATLIDANTTVLKAAGLAIDSIAQFLEVARQNGIPTHVSTTANEPRSTNLVALVGFSTLANDRNTSRPLRHVFSLTTFGAYDEGDGNGLRIAGTPSTGSRYSAANGSIQASLSSFIRPGLLQDLRMAFSGITRRVSPYVTMPSAGVLIGASPADATAGLSILTAGGAGNGNSSEQATTLELRSDTRFYLWRAHRVKVSADLRYDITTSTSQQNAYGSFVFASLADFATNRPVKFTRTMNARATRGAVWNGFLSLGDYWRVSRSFELLYGARVEGDVFAERPPLNAPIASALEVRSDAASNTVHISPRIGFTWMPRSARSAEYVVRNDHGIFVSPAIGVLRGGIGEFRALLPASLIANLSASPSDSTGLHSITCLGAAVPGPQWSSYRANPTTIPSDCVGDASTGTERDSSQPVSLLGRGYDAPRTWRANLAWTGYYRAFVWSLEGTYSLGLNQRSWLDRNFRDVPRFSLSGESSRPVYVAASSIAPSTGLFTMHDARLVPTLGQVMEARSDGRSEAWQLTATIMPDLGQYARAGAYASLAYTLTSARMYQRGYEVSTAISPSIRLWSRSAFTPRHAFVAQGSARIGVMTVSVFGRLVSGLPFTPMIASDVNGDGFANDRAFIPDPSTSSDPVLANAMQSLLRHAPSYARSCLERQRGRIAQPYSCTTPWTANASARIALNNRLFDGWARRVGAALYVSNIAAGVDQLLHGSRLRGWGTPIIADQALVRVTGFDPEASAFRYAVNPRFGSRDASGAVPSGPFRLTLELRIDLGVPTDQQILDRSLKPGRSGNTATRRTAEQVFAFYSRALPDPFAMLLALTDSLLLTPDQVRAIYEAQSRYKLDADSVLAPFSRWLAELPDHYNSGLAFRRQNEVIEAVLNLGRARIQESLAPLLNPIQIKLLPWPVDRMFHATGPLTLRDIRR